MTVPTGTACFLEVKRGVGGLLAALGLLCSRRAAPRLGGLAALAQVGVESAPPPPRGALVLGGESGSRAVALAVGKGRFTATVLKPAGGPLSGLKVLFRAGSRVIPAEPCGPGCYSAAAPARGKSNCG